MNPAQPTASSNPIGPKDQSRLRPGYAWTEETETAYRHNMTERSHA